MLDALGNTVDVGDWVVCSMASHARLWKGKVTRITPKCIFIQLTTGGRDRKFNPDQVFAFQKQPPLEEGK